MRILSEYTMLSNKYKNLAPLVFKVTKDDRLVVEKIKSPLLISRNLSPSEFMDRIFGIYETIDKIHSENPSIRIAFPLLNRIHDDGRAQFIQINSTNVDEKERLQKYSLMKSLKSRIIDNVFPNFAKRINIDHFYDKPIEKLKEFMEPLFAASYEERKISPNVVVMDIDVVKEKRFDRLGFFRCGNTSRSVKIPKSDPFYHLFSDIEGNQTRCYPVFQNNMKYISGEYVKTVI